MCKARVRFIALLITISFALVPALYGQFWKKKEYQNWSERECKELLRKSPWANEYMIAKAVFEPIGAGTGTNITGAPSVEGRETPNVTYRAEFWTAKPIRQAMMRLQQLDPKYKKMSEEEKKAFHQKAAQFVDTEYPDTVIVHLSYTTVQAWRLLLMRYWQSQSQDEQKKIFQLVGVPGRVEALRVIAQFAGQSGGGDFQLIFPRQVNGVALADGELKQLALEFQHPAIEDVLPAERVLIPFKVKNMILNDEVVY